MQGVVEAVFLLLHLDLRSGADIDDGHAAGQLGKTLLKLLAVVAKEKFGCVGKSLYFCSRKHT